MRGTPVLIIETWYEIVSLPDWHTEILYEGGISVKEFIDENLVYGAYSEQIGEVEDIVFGPDGKALSVIVEIEDAHLSVPWNRIVLDDPRDGIYGIIVPLTDESVEDYGLFDREVLPAAAAATQIRPVEEDVAPTRRAWRAQELIGDRVRLKEGAGERNFGYVGDLIVRDGELAAVVVRSDVAYGPPGVYALPFRGYEAGWHPGLDVYDLPYAREDIAGLEPFEHERLEAN